MEITQTLALTARDPCPKCGQKSLVVETRGMIFPVWGGWDENIRDVLVCTQCGWDEEKAIKETETDDVPF